MRTQPQGLRSTKIRMVPEVLEEDSGKEDDPVPLPSKKQEDMFIRIYDLNDEMREKIYTNQTVCSLRDQAVGISTSWSCLKWTTMPSHLKRWRIGQ